MKTVVYGNVARYFGKKREEDGHTHSWSCYLRPYNNEVCINAVNSEMYPRNIPVLEMNLSAHTVKRVSKNDITVAAYVTQNAAQTFEGGESFKYNY